MSPWCVYTFIATLHQNTPQMEMLRSGFQAVGLGSGDNDRKTGMPTSAETIERLVDRLNSSTLLDDRRDACRALKGTLNPIYP